MSISPFSARPASAQSEGRRARLVVLLVTLGIAASLLAYAISPSVRHAVGHAAHSVKSSVGNVLDRDKSTKRHPASKQPAERGHAHRLAPAHTHTTAASTP
jgi:hypothetical protein